MHDYVEGMKCDGTRPTQAMGPTPLTQEIEELAKYVAGLGMAIKGLVDKLAPVLAPEPPGICGQTATLVGQSQRCQLSEKVVALTSEVDAMALDVRDLGRRIAL